ncbi:MAG: response regulator, partial [Myxococcota bacterium]
MAEDDRTQLAILQRTLLQWGYNVEAFSDGEAVWSIIESGQAPSLMILDWMMPGIDGLEICRRVRRHLVGRPCYIIMLTGRRDTDDVVEGLQAGADDYILKPFHKEEFRARVRNGERLISLQQALTARVEELEAAIERVTQLQKLIPICSYCRRIRTDENFWLELENYLARHSAVRFSHGICPS